MNFRSQLFCSTATLAPETGAGGGEAAAGDAATGADAGAAGAAADPLAALDGKSALTAAAGAEGDKAKTGDADADVAEAAAAEKGDKTPEQIAADEAAAAAAADTGPEKFEIKAPEGFAALDEDALAAATPILKSLGVKDNETAQKVVGEFAPIIQGMLERAGAAAQAAQVQQIADIRKGWHTALLADKEVGGIDHDAKMGVAAKARDVLGTPALNTLLDETGIGSHPEIVRAFYRAGLQLQEGAIHRSDGSEQRVKDDGELFYGDAYKKA